MSRTVFISGIKGKSPAVVEKKGDAWIGSAPEILKVPGADSRGQFVLLS